MFIYVRATRVASDLIMEQRLTEAEVEAICREFLLDHGLLENSPPPRSSPPSPPPSPPSPPGSPPPSLPQLDGLDLLAHVACAMEASAVMGDIAGALEGFKEHHTSQSKKRLLYRVFRHSKRCK